MIIHKLNKNYMTRNDKPNSNWLNDENYYVVEDNSELYNKILSTNYEYEFVVDNNKLVDIIPTIVELKNNKLQELEQFINSIKELGVEYQDKWFKCDDEAMNNIMQTAMMVDVLLPITWFTRNGEDGTITISTKEEWLAFMSVLASKMADIKNKYYAYKYAIEQCETKEELDNIVFE